METFYQEYKPCAALAGVVDCYLSFRTVGAPEAVSEVHNCIPLDFAVWLIHIDGHRSRSFTEGYYFPEAYLVGIMKEPVLWTMQGTSTLFGVRLKPEAAIRVFQLPLSETFNHYLDTDSVWGKSTAAITARIQEAPDDLSRIAVVENFLLDRMARVPHKDKPYFTRALSLMRTYVGEKRLTEISQESFICDRQLQRAFKAELGLSPKAFLRIVRFREACQMARNQQYSFTDIAYTLGYSDPAHFVREFKTFAGAPPSKIFPRAERA